MKQTWLSQLGSGNRLERSRVRGAGSRRSALRVGGRKCRIWPVVKRTHTVFGNVNRLELSGQLEVRPRGTVGIEYALREQVVDGLSCGRLISRKNVIESSVLTDDHDHVFNGRGRRWNVSVSSQAGSDQIRDGGKKRGA